MTDKNQERVESGVRGSEELRGPEGFRGAEHGMLDQALDAALAKYAAVEPRSGLNERILANLQAEQMRVPERAWRRWGFAAAVAAVIVVAVALAWKSGPAQQQIVVHPSPTLQSPQQSPPQVEANDQHVGVESATTPKHRTTVRHSQSVVSTVVATANPKLDVFPSPQPLSEQERILMSYVADFHDQAVVIARVTYEELQRDRMEMLSNTSAATGPEESVDTKNTNR
jgi:hypothetical protein